MKASAGRSRMTPFSKRPTAVGAWVGLASPKPSSGRRMPTKTTSPSPISRAAATTISSFRAQGAAGLLDHRADNKARDHGAVGIAADHVIGDDLLADDDGATGRIGGLDREPEVAPQVRVARGIGALDMDDGNVRLDRADGKQA